jgi:hypothetical protein
MTKSSVAILTKPLDYKINLLLQPRISSTKKWLSPFDLAKAGFGLAG